MLFDLEGDLWGDNGTTDPSGDLWVPNAGAGTVTGFTKSQLTGSGSPAPPFNIAGPPTGLDWPWAVATEP